MAKIKYSALVSDMRNSLNGSTLSKNRYGSYMRNKVTPVNPQTSFQQAARQILGNLSSSFRELTIGQIKAWNNSGINFPFTDIFGDVKHLSGQTLFVKLNANLEKIGSPRILNPPLPTGFPEIAIESFVFQTEDGDVEAADILIEGTVVPANHRLVVYATPGLSRSISFVKNRYRFLGAFNVVGSEVSIGAEYQARFGTPLVGEVVHIRVALVAVETGQQGVPLADSAVVEVAP